MKVMIVDDEKMLRIGLKMMIPWEENGYQLYSGAEDGVMALAMIDKLLPDIIITDLKMPKMDGLELIQQLNNHPHFQGKIIVLSNYEEYGLVREALKLGAFDYLLKVTLKPSELLSVLSKTSELILNERHEIESGRKKTEALVKSYLLSKNQFFVELINDNHVSEQEIAFQADQLQIVSSKQPLFMLYIHIDGYDKNKWTRKQLMSFSIRNVVSELITGSPISEFADIGNREYMVLLAGVDRFASDTAKLQLAKQISDMLKLYLNLEANLIISKPFFGLRQVYEAYWACKQVVSIRYYRSAPILLHVSEVCCHNGSLPPHIVLLQDEMIARIRAADTDGLLQSMQSLLEAARREQLHPSLLLRCCLTVIDCWEATHIGRNDNRYSLPDTYRISLVEAPTADAFRMAFEEALQYLLHHAPPATVQKYRKEVREVIEYLIRHLDQKVTLELTADHVKMNKNHLSRLFKQETEKTIVHYLNELRLERARELLKNRDLSVKAVAEGVGIPDQFYFNRLFRRRYDQNPTDYKKSLLKNQNRP